MRRLALALALLASASLGQGPAVPAGGKPPAASFVLERETGPSSGVKAVLREVPQGVRTTLLVTRVSDGRVLEALDPDRPMIPASTLKLVTLASVLIDRQGDRGWWSTELTVPAAQSGLAQVKALTLRGSGDPTLTVSEGPNSLRALATQAYARGIRQVGELRLDETRQEAQSYAATVYEVPMPALRLREWEEREPATLAAMREQVGRAMLAELRRAGIQVQSDKLALAPAYRPYQPPQRQDEEGQPLPPDPVIPRDRRPEQGVASVRSGSVVPFVASTMRPSDNQRAEILLASLGLVPQASGRLSGALAREKALLDKLGVRTAGLVLTDGSGLGRNNRLTARALTDLLKRMYDLPYPLGGGAGSLAPADLYRQHRNAYIDTLPKAGTGEDRPKHDGPGGTMAFRLLGSGLDVRAKTGTLPGVSALSGYVTADSGTVLGFAILMNGPEDSPILTLRALQDRMVEALAAAH